MHAEIGAHLEQSDLSGVDGREDHKMTPALVSPVGCLFSDVEALEAFTSSVFPLQWGIRPKTIHVVLYGFGDSAGAWYGSSPQLPEGGSSLPRG